MTHTGPRPRRLHSAQVLCPYLVLGRIPTQGGGSFRFLRLSSRACSAAAMRDMPPVVLDGAHHDDATQESRACCALCNVKEFLIAITLFLILVDLFDVYGNLIRVTGTELLPFWGNHTDLYYTQVPELNFYDMIISVFDLACVVVLSLSGAPPPALSPTGLSRCAPAR